MKHNIREFIHQISALLEIIDHDTKFDLKRIDNFINFLSENSDDPIFNSKRLSKINYEIESSGILVEMIGYYNLSSRNICVVINQIYNDKSFSEGLLYYLGFYFAENIINESNYRIKNPNKEKLINYVLSYLQSSHPGIKLLSVKIIHNLRKTFTKKFTINQLINLYLKLCNDKSKSIRYTAYDGIYAMFNKTIDIKTRYSIVDQLIQLIKKMEK